MIFRDGHAHEDTSLALLKDSAFLIHSQQLPIDIENAYWWRSDKSSYRCPDCSQAAGHDVWIPPTRLHGHIDALATTILGDTYLFEHKSVVSHFFRRYWEEGKTPLDYFTQVVMYLRGLKEKGIPITAGALVIKNKDTGAILEFEFSYAHDPDILTITAIIKAPGHEYKRVHHEYPNLYEQALRRFEEVDRHIDNKTLPARLDDPDDIRCEYCGYRDLCWEDYEAPSLTERLIIPESLKSQAKEFIELDDRLAPLKKRHQELKDTLKAQFLQLHIAQALVDDRILDLATVMQTRLDESRLPVLLKKHFSKTEATYKLSIKSAIPKARASKTAKRPNVPRGPDRDAA
jgi:DNA-directed RNA polymerase subunit RPC12/RpoP